MTWSRRPLYRAVVIGFVLTGCLRYIAYAGQALETPVEVYKAGSDLTPPELLETDFAAEIHTDCDRTTRGKVKVAAVIDAGGVPRNTMFVQATGNDLDRLALGILGMDRFKPAQRNGIPVATGESIAMDLTGCIQHSKDASGNVTEHLRLGAVPTQALEPYRHYSDQVIFAQEMPVEDMQLGKGPIPIRAGISPPVPILHPAAEITGEALAKHIQGECMFSVVIDIHGLPHNVRIVKQLDPDLDQIAFEAVSRYRFKPALRKGMEPVPVIVIIAVNFRQDLSQPRLMRP